MIPADMCYDCIELQCNCEVHMTKGTITLRTDAETLDRLDKLAGSLDRSRNYLMNQALKSYLDEQAWQIEEIKAGLEELDRGEGVSAEEAEAIMDAFKKSKAT